MLNSAYHGFLSTSSELTHVRNIESVVVNDHTQPSSGLQTPRTMEMDDSRSISSDESSECVICYDKDTDTETNRLITLTMRDSNLRQCTPKVHPYCIQRWINVSRDTNCPLCRQTFIVPEGVNPPSPRFPEQTSDPNINSDIRDSNCLISIMSGTRFISGLVACSTGSTLLGGSLCLSGGLSCAVMKSQCDTDPLNRIGLDSIAGLGMGLGACVSTIDEAHQATVITTGVTLGVSSIIVLLTGCVKTAEYFNIDL